MNKNHNQQFCLLKFLSVIVLLIVSILLVPIIVEKHKEVILLNNSKLMLDGIDVNLVKAVRENMYNLEVDVVKTPEYKELKRSLYNLSVQDNKYRFIYFMGISEVGKILFLVDNEPEWSRELSPPGQLYYEANNVIYQIFEGKQSSNVVKIEDRWGTWISGFVGLYEGDDIIAVMGIDVEESIWKGSIATLSSIPILVLIIFAVFLLDRIFPNNSDNSNQKRKKSKK